jgi:putative transposase
MPEHLHCIWQLPPDDNNYAVRWALIKRLFSKKYSAAGGIVLPQSLSREKKGEAGIWQRRFWEHRIRDESDYWNHVHYIHYNPVKHRLVDRIEDWPYSTYHRFCEKGIYRNFDWGMFHTEEREIESGE